MTSHPDDIEFEEGSGNVFQDLGLESPEEELSKARLAWRILRLIDDRGLNRTQAARLLGIAQPKASRLLTGQTKGFSTEKLLHFLTRLDQDVRIIITKKPASLPHGRLLVQSVARTDLRTRSPKGPPRVKRKRAAAHAQTRRRHSVGKRLKAAG